LAEDSRVTLAVYNLLGQKVKTLVDSEQEAGYYTVRWDGTNDMGSKVSSGIYIYRVQSGNFVSTMKMNLLK
jgi:flagellar hook assembly protein FlgD